jgi:hypothetical protein
VTLGGAEAERVDVVRSNLLRVVTPRSPLGGFESSGYGAGVVDVVVTNHNVGGEAIAGESATAAAAYEYRHARLDAATPSDLLRVVATLLEELKWQVLPEVVLTQHTDWDPDVSTGFVEVASMPALVLTGPGTEENRFYSRNDLPEEALSATRVDVRRRPRTVDLLFDLIGISDSTVELHNLLSAATEFVERNPFLRVLREPADASAGFAEYELDYQSGGGFDVGARPSGSNVRFFSGSLVVRGVDFEGGFAGFSADALVDIASPLLEPVSLEVVEGVAEPAAPGEDVPLETQAGETLETQDGEPILTQ